LSSATKRFPLCINPTACVPPAKRNAKPAIKGTVERRPNVTLDPLFEVMSDNVLRDYVKLTVQGTGLNRRSIKTYVHIAEILPALEVVKARLKGNGFLSYKGYEDFCRDVHLKPGTVRQWKLRDRLQKQAALTPSAPLPRSSYKGVQIRRNQYVPCGVDVPYGKLSSYRDDLDAARAHDGYLRTHLEEWTPRDRLNFPDEQYPCPCGQCRKQRAPCNQT